MIEFNLETAAVQAGGAPAVSIIGIGGAGANVLDHIALEGVDDVELVSMNCDVRSLTTSMAQRKVQLGKNLTQGLGCGGDPELGQEAAAGSIEEIREALGGRRMIFVCAGLGGGTGSGAAPLVTRLARESGAFVIVFATLPFVFEGRRRMTQAQEALDEIRRYANALVCFENDKMGELVLPKKGVTEAFEVANRVICQSVRAVTTVATQPGLIRIGMDDLVTALRNADSRCLFGFGQASGESRASEALQLALKSPLLDRGHLLEKARNVLVHISGGSGLTLFEIESLMRDLSKHVSEDAQILFGAACDARLGDSLSVTIISSLGKGKADQSAAVDRSTATTPKPAPPVTSIISPHSHSVPILSVQPRQAPPPPPSSSLEPALTMTIATSAVPALQLNAPPLVPQKPARLSRSGGPEPDLFAVAGGRPAGEAAVETESTAAPEAAETSDPPVEEPVVQEVPDVVAEAESAFESEPLPEPVNLEMPEEEEIGIDEPAAEEAPLSGPEVEEEVVAETEIAIEAEEELEIEDEEPAEVEDDSSPVLQHPAFDAARAQQPSAPMRPIEPPTPPAKSPARKFDLREILQRQRQTRLGGLQRPAPPTPPARQTSAPAPAPPRQTPARSQPRPPLRSDRVVDRIPDPDNVEPIRPIPAARSTSPFIPSRPPAPGHPPVRKPQRQATFDETLSPAPAMRGARFEKAEPTVEEGEDLDVPTFLRRKR